MNTPQSREQLLSLYEQVKSEGFLVQSSFVLPADDDKYHIVVGDQLFMDCTIAVKTEPGTEFTPPSSSYEFAYKRKASIEPQPFHYVFPAGTTLNVVLKVPGGFLGDNIDEVYNHMPIVQRGAESRDEWINKIKSEGLAAELDFFGMKHKHYILNTGLNKCAVVSYGILYPNCYAAYYRALENNELVGKYFIHLSYPDL